MELKKPLDFLKNLQKELDKLYVKKSKSKVLVRNKSKFNYNPVTNFDKYFEKFIRFSIIKKFPNDSIIGEEFKNKNSNSYYQWSIDPIDGTKAFVIGVPTWSNLIGLSFKNKSLIGLANFPGLNKFYINDKKNAYVFKKNKKVKLNTSKNNNLNSVKILGNFHGNISLKKQKKIFKRCGKSFRNISYDALSYCLLAEGKIDAVIESNLKPYDIIPLIPIIKKSGGCITNWNNEPAEKAGNILATSNKKLHNKLLKVLKNI